jgi:hypothetical protein
LSPVKATSIGCSGPYRTAFDAAQATEVLAAILGLQPHLGAAVLPAAGCVLAIIGIDHTLGSVSSGCRYRPEMDLGKIAPIFRVRITFAGDDV